MGLAAALKPEFCNDMFSSLLPSCFSLSPGFLNFKMQLFLPHWGVARFK